MRTNKYWKYFDRAMKEYKKRVISDEEVKEILDERMNE
ncbi:DNA-directed RNA polymerase subunit N (RpoN/RPB10) [Lysinibacillus sp. RC46]